MKMKVWNLKVKQVQMGLAASNGVYLLKLWRRIFCVEQQRKDSLSTLNEVCNHLRRADQLLSTLDDDDCKKLRRKVFLLLIITRTMMKR